MDSIGLRLFGTPRFEVNGKPVVIQRRKASALVIYMAVTGQNHSRDTLAALLWPDYDQVSARGNLRRELSRVKQEFHPNLLEVERDYAGINPDVDVRLDIAAFQELIRKVRVHEHEDEETLCEDCLANLEDAVKLYTGDFMEGFTLPDSRSFEDWIFFQGEGLRQMLSEALKRLVELYSLSGEFEKGVESARKWLSLDVLNEEVHRWLIRLYAWQGQYSAALRQYQDCKRIFKAELGVGLEKETISLYEAVKARQLNPPGRLKPADTSTEKTVSTLAGRYVKEELIAVGGYGEVYCGKDLITGKKVVIKRIKQDIIVQDSSHIQRFLQEGEALRRLNHPNIVTFLDAFEEDGQHNLVMEFISGGSLRSVLDEHTRLPVERILDIALQLSDALSRAHYLKIIHRDLKPENVLLSEDGTPRLMDFGVARIMNADVRLTQTGSMLGSPLYVSPEILRGEEPGTSSDIWSFGIMLYEMLTGVPPFRGENVGAVLISILEDPVPPLTTARPDVPPALANLIDRMLEKDPLKRLHSIRQVGVELESIRLGWGIPDSIETTRGGSSQSSMNLVLSTGFSEIRENTEPRLTLFLERLAPFVAREDELEKLNNYLNEALKGSGRVVFVAGEAGQGKTSLLGAFSRQVQEAHPELITAGGNCNAYTGIGDPYLPFREMIHVIAGEPEVNAASGVLHPDQPRRLELLLPVVLQKLVETAPDLIGTIIPVQSLLPHASTGGPRLEALLDHLESEAHQHFSTNIQQSALIEQYTRLMQELSEHAPLLLILDDLQWADQGTANLLFNLGRRLRGYRIMILGAYRPDEVAVTRDGQPHPLSKVLYELQRDYGDLIIDLSKAEGRSFVNQLLDIESNCLGEDFRETLYQQTGGHPLFTTELLNEMRVRGDLVKDEDGCWVEGPSLDWEILPARVEGAIGERINRLEEPLVRLLETASFEGEEFTAEVVSQVMNLEVRDTIRKLSSELDKKHKLVRALGSKRVGGKRLSRYRFQHILIQKYLYQRLDEVERVYQHERVASALESLYEDEIDEAAVQLAWQYEAAEIPEKAVVYLKMAGEQAQRAAALDEAARYYKAALKDWPKDDLAGRADLLQKLGICLWITSRLMDALKTFEEGFRLFQNLENWQGAGEIQRQIGRLHWEMGDREKSLYHYQQALSVLEMEPESVELARAVSSISQMHMLAGEYDQALAWGERALALAQKLGADDVILHAMNNLGSSYFETGNPVEGARLLQESHLRALELRLPHDVCRALVNLGEGWTGHGKFVEARKVFQELSRYAEMNHISVFAGSALVELGKIEWITGEWSASLNQRPMIHQWLERGQATAYLDITANVFFAMQMNDLGLHQQAYKMLERIHSVVKGFNEMQMTAPFMEQWAKALAGIGKRKEATQGFVELVKTIGEREFIIRQAVMPLLTACSWYETDPLPGNLELSKRSLNMLGQVHKQYNSVFTAAAFAEGMGIDHLREGDVTKALESFTESSDLWRSLDSIYYRARVLNRMGEALVLTGKEKDALTVYREAYGILRKLGEQIDEEKLKNSFVNLPFIKELQQKITASDQTT